MVITKGRRLVLPAVVALVVAVAAVVALVVVRSGGPSVTPPVASPSPTVSTLSPTPSVTPTPTAGVVAPVLPEEAKARTQKGAEAFFRYVIAVYNYSFAALDTMPLQAVSETSCKFCAGVVSDVTKAKAQGLRYDGAELTVVALTASPGDPSNGLVVVAVVDQAEGRTLMADGSSETSVPASKGVRLDARLRWSQAGWRVVGVALPEKK